jgi:hypothetical protein
MDDISKLEAKILKMLTSVSYFESTWNKSLTFQAQNILKALEYYKAVIQIEKPKSGK